MAKCWYALHTYSGHENKVKAHLDLLVEESVAEGAIEQVVVPTEEVVELRAGKKESNEEKVPSELRFN